MSAQFWPDKITSGFALYERLGTRYPAAMRIFRFILSGGTATAVNLGTLLVLTNYFDVWYLYSSIAAFVVSFFVSFTLQKFWTFENRTSQDMHAQAAVYVSIIFFGLALNTTLLYAFVEHMGTHYLVGQLVSGLFIAVINYFGYKHLVFIERLAPREEVERFSIMHVVLLSLSVLLFLSLALFRLSENPPTWQDEGSIVQVSINLAQEGVYGIQTAPGQFMSTDFLTTGFPVIYPISLAFVVFGTEITVARIVMLVFMGFTCMFSYVLVRKLTYRRTVALTSILLLVSFAPFYGHGKNVLGEVPGLTFFLASLLALWYAQRRADMWPYLLSGALLGLSMATKPIYLFIIAPAAFLMLCIAQKRPSWYELATYIAGASVVLLAWFSIQVKSIGALQQLLFAANAANVPLVERIADNSAQFVTQLQPAYFLGLVLLWLASLAYRRWQRVQISDIERFAFVFTVVNLLLYIASRGFYRYFFAAEALALIFLPLALLESPFADRYRKIFNIGCGIVLTLLIAFQAYQTLFRSWVSEHRLSERTSLLDHHMSSLPEESSVFLYNVPEAAIFLSSDNYFQYLNYGDNVIRGEENLVRLYEGMPDYVLVDTKFPDEERIAPLYKENARFDKYTLFEKITR